MLITQKHPYHLVGTGFRLTASFSTSDEDARFNHLKSDWKPLNRDLIPVNMSCPLGFPAPHEPYVKMLVFERLWLENIEQDAPDWWKYRVFK